MADRSKAFLRLIVLTPIVLGEFIIYPLVALMTWAFGDRITFEEWRELFLDPMTEAWTDLRG